MISARHETAGSTGFPSVSAFSALNHGLLEKLARFSTRERFASGREIPWKLFEGHLVLLGDGELREYSGGRFCRTIGSPAVLNPSALSGPAAPASNSAGPDTVFSPLSDSTLTLVPVERLRELAAGEPELAVALHRVMAEEIARLRTDNAHWRNRFQGVFKPGLGAVIEDGPFVMDPFDQYLFVLEMDRPQLRKLLPRGVRPVPGLGGRYLLTFNFFTSVHSAKNGSAEYAYHETTPFIPCLGSSLRPAAFIPELYPDSFMPIAMGREVYGFPKRFGETTRREQTIDFALDGRHQLRAQWGEGRGISQNSLAGRVASALGGRVNLPRPLEALFTMANRFRDLPVMKRLKADLPVLLHRRLFDANAKGKLVPRIDELTEVKIGVDSVGDIEELTSPEIRFFESGFPFQGRCLAAFRLRLGLRFGEGKAVKNYR